MKAGSMEGLIGASLNMEITNVPMKVYREAERKGDLDTMERAMGYVGDFSQKAKECSEKAQTEIVKELKEEKEEIEKVTKERLEDQKEKEKSQEKVENSTGVKVEISEEGKALANENTSMESPAVADGNVAKNYNEQGMAIAVSEEPEISVKV